MMGEKIEFEARLTFEPHRGCGTVITTWPPSTGARVLSQCQNGCYHVTLTPAELEPLPCPFCGGKMKVWNDPFERHGPCWIVECEGCGWSRDCGSTRSGAVEWVNRRAK